MKILITVIAYPLPSRSYDELVCTAGFDENRNWVRIYPVPLKFLKGLKKEGKMESYKYTWIEIDLKERTDDFRPESYSPVKYDFKDVNILKTIGTHNSWHERKSICLNNVYTNIKKLIEDSKEPKNVSLAVFKPAEILEFIPEEDSRDWKDEWKRLRNQTDLFGGNEPEKMISKIPYKFYYRFKDDEGNVSKLMIEDWELGSLYWKCLERANNDEVETLKKVKQKYFDEFLKKKDIYLFLGTTKQWHQRRANNPFVIVGVFYPPKKDQLDLF
ncbi:MAG TPA: hypothetical protein PKA90_14005 [Ignavibacteria bacterium]|nr:hypothetical protein [Ignavibacteria bacterium]HMR41533.1 hypothetical protein [Ignavibacteria bacterium]